MVDLGRLALERHAAHRGKVQILPKCRIAGRDDFAVWYTPGVAEPCRAIAADPALSFRYTNRGNCVAIVSDGTRVLGLGDIGPEAGLPVMEGKALLFKHLGGVDAVPLCVRAATPERLVELVRALEPSFGGINLEDIAQPKCFRVLDELREALAIPVWHDDQQGSATAALAGLINALEVVGKRLAEARIAMIGMGAANVSVYRLLRAFGTDPTRILACDSSGLLRADRPDAARLEAEFPDKWRVCRETNPERLVGGPAEALRGADACLAFSAPGPELLRPEWVAGMARDAVVLACANPVPEILPDAARAAGARIVATGRSDYPNQVNNALVFPGLFRGVLDVGARRISDGMAIAAAHALAALGREQGLADDRILPDIADPMTAVRVAVAVGAAARAEGLAMALPAPDPAQAALDQIMRARRSTAALMEAGVI